MHRATFIICLGVAFAAISTAQGEEQPTFHDGFLNFKQPKINVSSANQKSPKQVSTACPCVFPFKIFDRWYHYCTDIFYPVYVPETGPICATSVADDGTMLTWEYCSDDCPPPPPPTPNPLNEPPNCYCGLTNPVSPLPPPISKIVNGMDSDVGMFPWQATLLFNDGTGCHLYNQFCGGTLVSEKYIITAAHCTIGAAPGDFFVGLGTTIFGAGASTSCYGFVNIFYDGYDPNGPNPFDNDIAIVELDTKVNLFDNPYIKPACLPSFEYYGLAVVSGFGTIYYQGSAESVLQYVNVEVVPLSECPFPELHTQDMLCAVGVGNDQGVCQGDSGGPLVALQYSPKSYTLTGVVSWGEIPCAVSPQLYVNVSYFSDFISSTIDSEGQCPPYDYGPIDTTLNINTWPSTTPCYEELVPCNPKNTMNKIVVYEKIKKVANKEDCNMECVNSWNYGDGCLFWDFKDNKKQNKRICYLLRNEPKKKKAHYSGSRGCYFE